MISVEINVNDKELVLLFIVKESVELEDIEMENIEMIGFDNINSIFYFEIECRDINEMIEENDLFGLVKDLLFNGGGEELVIVLLL